MFGRGLDLQLRDAGTGQLVIQGAGDESGDAPMLFTAIQEFRLKLVPKKGPVEVIVIDQIDDCTQDSALAHELYTPDARVQFASRVPILAR
jgi:DNA polymerase III delta prime subunit